MSKQKDLNSLLNLSDNREVDIILVKSISRFSRSVLDGLITIRNFTSNGTMIYFDIMSLLITERKRHDFIVSMWLAVFEQESRNLSDNIKWTLDNNYKMGVQLNMSHRILGYNLNENNEYIIHEQSSNIIIYIFERYLMNVSLEMICDELEDMGATTISGKKKWNKSTILYILHNITYTGVMLMPKTYKKDIPSKRENINHKKKKQYLVENNHPAIISKNKYDLVQELLRSRSTVKSYNNITVGRKQSKYFFSNVLVCSECGSSFRRILERRVSGNYYVWKCASHVESKKESCKLSVKIKELDLKEEIAKLFKDSKYNEPKARTHIKKIEVFKDKYEFSIE